MDEKEKPSEKPEKRYTRKQIYDDPEVAKHVLENQDDYSEDDVNLAKVTFMWSIHQTQARYGIVEPMPEGFLTKLFKKFGVGTSAREKIKNDPELNKTLDKMNSSADRLEKILTKATGKKIKLQRYTLD